MYSAAQQAIKQRENRQKVYKLESTKHKNRNTETKQNRNKSPKWYFYKQGSGFNSQFITQEFEANTQ